MVELGLDNYYGGVYLEQINGKWYLTIEDWDDEKLIEVSNGFAKAVKEEFATKKEVILRSDLLDQEG